MHSSFPYGGTADYLIVFNLLQSARLISTEATLFLLDCPSLSSAIVVWDSHFLYVALLICSAVSRLRSETSDDVINSAEKNAFVAINLQRQI